MAKHWSLVRHTHGLLGRKIQNMDLSCTDLLVRQKQVTIGLPPHNEVVIDQPLGASELRDLIASASCGDMSAASLTQEVLCYLGMFVRTEPRLFHGMLRLRVGLILQVMISEIKRTLAISDEEAADKLLNLPPFETKNLLHHIMSGQEYEINHIGSKVSIRPLSNNISKGEHSRRLSLHNENDRKMSVFQITSEDSGAGGLSPRSTGSSSSLNIELDTEEEVHRTGMWVRRRLLDGSLNRYNAFVLSFWLDNLLGFLPSSTRGCGLCC